MVDPLRRVLLNVLYIGDFINFMDNKYIEEYLPIYF